MEAEKQRVEKARAALTDLHLKVWEYFKNAGRGRHNAIKKEQLACMFNCSERQIRKIIHDLRAAYRPIGAVSDGAGYFIPANSVEARHVRDEILKRARVTEMTARPFEILAERYKARGM